MQREKSYPKFVRLYFKMLLSIDQTCEKVALLPTLCRLSQTLQIMAYIIINTYIRIDNNHQLLFGESFYTYFDLFLLTQTIILILTLCVVLIIQQNIFNEITNVNHHRSLAKWTDNIFIVITIYYEFFYLIFGFCMFQKLVNGKFSKGTDIGIVLLLTILQIWQTPLFLHQRLIGYVTFLLPILASFIPFETAIYLLLIVCAFTIYTQQNSQKNFFLVQLLFTCIWAILQTSSDKTNLAVSLLSLTFILLIVGVSYFLRYYYQNNPKTQLQINKQLLKFYQMSIEKQHKKKEKIVYDNLQEQILYEKYIDQSQNNSLTFTREAKYVDFEKWGQLKKQVLWQKIVDSKETNLTFSNMVFYFKAGIYLRKNVLKLIKEMKAYLLKNPNFGVRQHYQIYRVSRYAAKIYQEKREKDTKNIQLSEVVQTQDKYKEFYSLLAELLNQLKHFWRGVVNKKMSVTAEGQQSMKRIILTHKKLMSRLKSLNALKIDRECSLGESISRIVNFYQRSNKLQQQNEKQKAQIMQFLILRCEQIKKMSLKLQRQLKYTDQGLQNLSIKRLVPFHLDRWISKKCSEFLLSGQNQPFIIPFVDSEGCLMLKNCQLFLISQFTHLNFFLKLHPRDSASRLLLLVNIKKQKIECLSTQLRNQISMSEQVFKQFVSGEITLFFNDLFSIQLGEKELNKLTEGNTLKAKIIYGQLQKKMPRMKARRNYQINLHFQSKIQIENNGWVILSLYSDWLSANHHQVSLKRTSQYQSQINEYEDIAERWSQQQFFCKIENPYKSKILQNLSKRSIVSFKSRCVQLSVINVVTILLFYMSILLKSATIQNYDFNDSVQSIRNISNQYTYLLHLYCHSYSKAFFSNDKASTMAFINSEFFNNTAKEGQLSRSYDMLIQYYTDAKDQAISTLNSIYLPYLSIQAKNIQYNISFDKFQITSNTAFTTLYDFIIQIEKGFSNSSQIAFLAKNYGNIVKIMPHYEIILTTTNDFHSQYTTFFYIALSFYVSLIISIIFNLVLAYFMVQTHIQIRGVYSLIQQQDVNKVLVMINNLSQQVENQSESQDTEAKQKYKSIKTEVQFRPIQNKQLKQKTYSHPKMEVQVIQQKPQAEENPLQSPRLKKFFSYIYFSLFVVIMVTIVFIYEWRKVIEDQKYFNSIKCLAQKYEASTMWIERYYIGLFQAQYYQNYFGNYSLEQVPIHKIQFFETDLPDIFKTNLNSVFSLCDEDILKLVKIPLFKKNYEDCMRISEGILSKGFSGALQFYQTLIRQEKTNSIEGYLETNQFQSSKISSIISVKELLLSYLNVNLLIFQSNLQQFVKNYALQQIKAVALIVCASLIIFGLQVKIIKQLKEEKQLTLQLIQILPVSIIQKMKIMSYIRKRSILEKLETL